MEVKEQALGKWDNLVVGYVPDEMDQRERAQRILKSQEMSGISDDTIKKNLKERDPSGYLRLCDKNKF